MQVGLGTAGGDAVPLLPEQGVTGYMAMVCGLPTRGKISVRYGTRYAEGWQLCDSAYIMNVEMPVPLPGSPAE